VREARQAILDGKQDVSVLLTEKVGEIKARIIERDGQIVMVKDCPQHGHFEDVMSIDPAMFKHLEESFPGPRHPGAQRRDAAQPRQQHHQVRPRRGAHVDLTNRCNMMCDPCFMDANQVGFVHELTWEDIKTVLDNAISIKPKRQMSVQFSGGEPTLSPYFLDAVRYAREGRVQQRPGGDQRHRVRQEPEFCREAAEAGLRYAYLQFDGIGNAANSHRRVGNLFDVKLRAIENLWSAGVDIVPVVTIVNGVNNEQVGRIIEFALDNPRKICFVSFQPVSFTGRDEEVTDERRAAQRYTLSHLAHDVKEPDRHRRAHPRLVPDLLHGDLLRLGRPSCTGPTAEWGQLSCGCHPNCGIGMAVMSTRRRRSGCRHRVPQRRPAGEGTWPPSTTRRGASGGLHHRAWRSRCCATTTRSRRRRT
jgi:7,8-dihydro-6-hydroxymethylpterin dimethyltransferase